MKIKVYWTNLLLYSILSCTIFSCQSKTGFNSSKPQTPVDQELDLNEDSVFDFRIHYGKFGWEDINVHGEGIEGSFTQIDENSIYSKGAGPTLFLRPKDTVWSSPKGDCHWDGTWSKSILSIANSSDHNFSWQNSWDIQSTSTHEYYYLGLQIKNSKESLIGYVKLSLDAKTGQVQIKDKKFTNKGFMVIDE